MNENFNIHNSDHRNLIAKLNNTVADLNWYAFRFMLKYGLPSSPKTGIADAIKLTDPPPELQQIIQQYETIKTSSPKLANALFYSTWQFLHDFDNELRNVHF
jgi:hypothetical protein